MIIDNPDAPPPSLRPTAKGRVMDLVAMAGIDTSGWALTRDGMPVRTAPSKNPQYCYGWSFSDGERSVCCLWWEEMREDTDGIYTRLDVLDHQRVMQSTVRKTHTNDLVEVLLRAYEEQHPIQVLVVSGDRRLSPTSKKQSRVRFRQKDPKNWYVTEVSRENGSVLLRRGGQIIGGEWMSDTQLALPRANDADAIASDWSYVDSLDLPQTERTELRKARIGQGRFRDGLLQRWGNACAVTGISIKEALRASHCVPWAKATNAERLTPKNGLLLCSTLDALFDAGLITFSDDGELLATARIRGEIDKITALSRLRYALDEEEKAFLRRHRHGEYEKFARARAAGFAS